MVRQWKFVFGLALALTLLGPPPTFSAQAPQLPQVRLDTTYTAPTGQQTSVPAGGDLQSALNAAQPGDAIILQAGATYSGNFTLPTKSGSGWIYVQSSALSSLPAAGTRVGPAQANLMPKIVSPNTTAAISTAAGAHHFRFVGVEITTTWASTSATNYVLVSLEAPGGNTSLAQPPTDLVFDRCYIHGTPTANVRRAILIDGNLLENNWADAQNGYGVLFTVRNQDGTAPWSTVRDVTFTNNILRHSGGGVNMMGADYLHPSQPTQRILIQNNLFDDISN